MAPAFPTSSSTIASAALAGLILGVAVSSFLGVGILAGFVAVALAVGVFLALAQEGGGGKVVPGVSALSAMVFPLAVAELGEDGMLPAAAAGFAVLAAAHLLRGRPAGSLPALGLATGAVLHLGLLGSFLVLLTAEGNRLLPAMVLMAAAFETAYVTAAARTATARPKAAGAAGMSQWPNPRAGAAGVVACQVAALLAGFFLPSRLSLVSLVLLGTLVGAAALLGHVSAAAVTDVPAGRRELGALDPAIFSQLNALLFAAGAFYYGFRLYLT